MTTGKDIFILLEDAEAPSDTLAERLSKLSMAPTAARERKFVARNKGNAIPNKYLSILTKEQKISLANLEFFGWKIWFIRRPLFLEPQVFLINEESGLYGHLAMDGELDLDTRIHIRR